MAAVGGPVTSDLCLPAAPCSQQAAAADGRRRRSLGQEQLTTSGRPQLQAECGTAILLANVKL